MSYFSRFECSMCAHSWDVNTVKYLTRRDWALLFVKEHSIQMFTDEITRRLSGTCKECGNTEVEASNPRCDQLEQIIHTGLVDKHYNFAGIFLGIEY